jgi:hypothetical protein
MLCEQTVQQMGEAISAQAAARHERETDASTAVHPWQAEPPMNRNELETRILEIERDIEQHRTAVWLCEHEREQLRHSLRKLINDESKAATP